MNPVASVPPCSADVVVELEGLVKAYREGAGARQVLKGVQLSIRKGEFVVLTGRSGSGKSTLLNLVSGIDLPSAGHVRVGGADLANLSERQRTLLRRRVGFVYQFFNLIPIMTVWENLLLPIELEGVASAEQRARATKLLERVGLGDRTDSFPDQLSGGEQQRVAIARALVAEPLLVLADEPTGNLDAQSGGQILELLNQMVRAGRHTVLMVSHGQEALLYADRILDLVDGRVQERRVPSP